MVRLKLLRELQEPQKNWMNQRETLVVSGKISEYGRSIIIFINNTGKPNRPTSRLSIRRHIQEMHQINNLCVFQRPRKSTHIPANK